MEIVFDRGVVAGHNTLKYVAKTSLTEMAITDGMEHGVPNSESDEFTIIIVIMRALITLRNMGEIEKTVGNYSDGLFALPILVKHFSCAVGTEAPTGVHPTGTDASHDAIVNVVGGPDHVAPERCDSVKTVGSTIGDHSDMGTCTEGSENVRHHAKEPANINVFAPPL